MTCSVSPRITALALLLTGVVIAGCNGSAAPVVDGGPNERPVQNVGDAGGTRTDSALVADARPVVDAAPLPPPPAANAMSKVLAGGRARMVGSIVDVCSNQVPASGNGDRWCALTLPDRVIGRTDLWVINATKATDGTVIKCDGTDANCLQMTTDVWTGQPMQVGLPTYPSTHRFDGDTLIFHANAPADQIEYKGPIFAWRPGWPAPKQISGNAAFDCAAHPSADAYICEENTTDPMAPIVQFDLTAGKLSGTGPTTVARITPLRPGTGSAQSRISITRAGDSLVWSTGGTTTAEVETLYALKFDDLADPVGRRVTVGTPGISRWVLSADNAKIYYFRQYNYPAVGTDPRGTLTMADFPSGLNEVTLLPNVVVFQALSTGPGVDGGIGFFDTLTTMGTATYKIIKDRAMPAAITTVVTGVPGILALSRDLQFLYFFRNADPVTPRLTDGYVVKTDGISPPCTLSPTTTSDQYGTSFTPNSQMVMWVDNVDINEQAGQGWVANPVDCTKRMFSQGIDYWFLHGNEGMVFSDSAMGAASKLKYVTFPGGNSIGTPVLIQDQIVRVFGVAVDQSFVLYNIAGTTGQADGLFAFKTPFVGTGLTDGGPPPPTGDAGP
jgi:hypothetical protein